MLRTITSFFALLIATCLLLACSQENTDIATDKSSEETSIAIVTSKSISQNFKSAYQKPGAAVRLKHNYDGHSNVGEPELVQLIFSESYSTGVLNISLKSDQGLTVTPPESDYSFAMQGENFHSLDISVNPQNQGKHYLQLFVSASESNGSPKHRVFAIAFYVGDAFLSSEKQAPQQQKSSADTMIFLPSEETVIQ